MQRKESMQLSTILNTNTTLTMSSKEIAELTGKRHDNVLRDVRMMLEELYGEEGFSSFEESYTHEQNGQSYTMYILPKLECLMLLHGYKFMLNKDYAKVIERFSREEITPKFLRKEYSFGEDIVMKLFDGYNVISQFSVLGKYKIDWYVPELKLAIEFDEAHHASNKTSDAIRQQEIENHLGCRFLRYKN